MTGEDQVYQFYRQKRVHGYYINSYLFPGVNWLYLIDDKSGQKKSKLANLR